MVARRTESELKEIKEFRQELNSTTTPKQLIKLLEGISKKNFEELEELACEKIASLKWNQLNEIIGHFIGYASEALYCRKKGWARDILDQMKSIASTPEEIQETEKLKTLYRGMIDDIAQRHFNPTKEQLYEEFISQSTL